MESRGRTNVRASWRPTKTGSPGLKVGSELARAFVFPAHPQSAHASWRPTPKRSARRRRLRLRGSVSRSGRKEGARPLRFGKRLLRPWQKPDRRHPVRRLRSPLLGRMPAPGSGPCSTMRPTGHSCPPANPRTPFRHALPWRRFNPRQGRLIRRLRVLSIPRFPHALFLSPFGAA